MILILAVDFYTFMKKITVKQAGSFKRGKNSFFSIFYFDLMLLSTTLHHEINVHIGSHTSEMSDFMMHL
jgi:hypothetical protein